jgi:hypothetical protein
VQFHEEDMVDMLGVALKGLVGVATERDIYNIAWIRLRNKAYVQQTELYEQPSFLYGRF